MYNNTIERPLTVRGRGGGVKVLANASAKNAFFLRAPYPYSVEGVTLRTEYYVVGD